MTRRYPERPIACAGGVVLTADGRVVLVRRASDPAAGTWTLPGGAVEVGESAREAAAREILEETGLVVEVGDVIDVFDRVFRDAAGRVEFHYVIVDYVCRVRGGTPTAGSDVAELALADPTALDGFDLTDAAQDVIARARIQNR
jgi:8-oxo-dGTP diphosphatase